MIFIHLGRMRKKPEKEMSGEATKTVEEFRKKEIKFLNWDWMPGRCDTVFIFEAASEKEAMKLSIDVAEWVTSETLLAIPKQDAANLI